MSNLSLQNYSPGHILRVAGQFARSSRYGNNAESHWMVCINGCDRSSYPYVCLIAFDLCNIHQEKSLRFYDGNVKGFDRRLGD